MNRFVATLLLLGLPCSVLADNARDWQNVPKDINIVFGYYDSVRTNTAIDTSLPLNGASLNASLYILRYARSFDIDGRSSGIQVIQPYVHLKASLDDSHVFPGAYYNDGSGDTQFGFVHNLFGAPALSEEAFSRWTPGPFLTAALWVTAPTGEYDNSKLINIGANRWNVKPELAFGVPIGPTWLEINPMVTFYQQNDEYQGHRKLAQRPLWLIEGHYSLTLNRALWISLDGSYSTGGETRIDGTLQDNKQENVLVGASLGWQLSPQFGGAIAYTDTVAEKMGSPDVDTLMFRLQYAW